MGKNPWIESWEVTGSQGDQYVVSQAAAGNFGCSCLGWKFKKAPKPDCKHIRAIKEALGGYNLQAQAKEAVVAPKPKCQYCGLAFRTMVMLNLHESSCRTKKYAEWYNQQNIVQKQAEYRAALAEQPEPQEVEVDGNMFTVARKFKFKVEA